MLFERSENKCAGHGAAIEGVSPLGGLSGLSEVSMSEKQLHDRQQWPRLRDIVFCELNRGLFLQRTVCPDGIVNFFPTFDQHLCLPEFGNILFQ